jgi:hypothetical protein
MPCRCDGYEEYEGTRIRKELDEVTAILCEVMEAIESHNAVAEFQLLVSPRAYQWYGPHKEADKQRKLLEERQKEATRAKARAIAKLTPAERKLLNL